MTSESRWNWGTDRFDTNDSILRAVFFDEAGRTAFSLPRRCRGSFETELKELFDLYRAKVSSALKLHPTNAGHYDRFSLKGQEKMCRRILLAIEHIHDGFPHKSYNTFSNMMDELSDQIPLPYVTENVNQSFDHLYRVRSTDTGRNLHRRDIFHVPAAEREIISTARYSIAGYPSLYLADSLELASREMGHPYASIASKFRFNTPSVFQIIDLGIRPQDYSFAKRDDSDSAIRKIALDFNYTSSYVFWFPLVAACSFVRARSSGQFSDEYVIPQLLMQWLRSSKNPPDGIKPPGGGPGTVPPPSGGTGDPPDSMSSLNAHLKAIENALGEIKGSFRFFRSERSTPAAENNQVTWDIATTISKTVLDEQKDIIHLILSTPRGPKGGDGIGDPHNPIDTNVASWASRMIRIVNGLTEFHPDAGWQGDAEERGQNQIIALSNHSQDELEQAPNRGGHGLAKGRREMPKSLHDNLNKIRNRLVWIYRQSLVGIRYFSCKDLLAPVFGRNYVFPTERLVLDDNGVPTKDGNGRYCALLNSMLEWTEPIHRQDYESIQAWQKDLDDKARSDFDHLRPPAPPHS